MLSLLILGLFGFSGVVWGEEAKSDPKQNFLSGLTVGKPMIYGNLTIFPIVCETSTALDFDIITLDEGMSSGKVVITEQSRASLAALFNISLATLDEIEKTGKVEGAEKNRLSAEEICAISEYLGGGSYEYQERNYQRIEPNQRYEQNNENESIIRDPVGKLNDATEGLNENKLKSAREKIANAPNLSGDSVNQLLLRNDSDKHLYLMAGEMLKGARQDRIVAKDTVIKPHSGWVVMDVFCVEHGRWSYEGAEFKDSGKLGHSTLRYVAQGTKEQGKVWNEVAEKRGDLAKSAGITLPGEETGTMEEAYSSEKIQALIKPYLSSLANPASEGKHVLGVVACYGEELLATDIFGSETLFAKLYPKLLESYAMDVAGKGKPKGKLSTEQVRDIIEKLIAEGVGEASSEKGSSNRAAAADTAFENQYEGKTIHINSYK
jgi:hypothetical protein